jgi:hypothetical protein
VKPAAIYQLDRGFSVWAWLCADHLKARQAAGWEVKERRPAPHPITCDDCKTEGR